MTEALKDTGTITVTGNYSTIPESHGGKKYRGAAIGGTMGYSYSAQVVEVTRRRGDRRGHRRQGLGRARLRQGAQPPDGRGPGAGLGLDGHGPGHERGGRLSRRPACSPPTCSTTACRPSRIRRRSRSASSRATTRTGRSAPRRRAKARSPPSCRRSPTPSPTPSASASTICR